MAIESFRDLKVWEKAVAVAVESYRVTVAFPSAERFALTLQIRRAAVSIAANIAEGHGRTHRGDYLHHLSIARGSLKELETLLVIAERLEYVRPEEISLLRDLCESVSRMTTNLKRSLTR